MNKKYPYILISLFVIPAIVFSMPVDFNPHGTINMITSWNHRDVTRQDSDKQVRDAWEEINYTSSYGKNTDRPVTSKASPVLVEAGKSIEGHSAYAILEEYQLEYRPSPRRSNGKSFGFAKLFNFSDIPQWRMHHPPKYVETTNDGTPMLLTTDFNAAPLLCKSLNSSGGAIYYTSENAPIYGNEGCVPEKQAVTNETYSIFMEFNDSGGLEFGSHMSQINYTKSGHVKSDGRYNVTFETGRYPNSKPAINFNLIKGLVDFSEQFVMKSDSGKKYLRVRALSKADGYGPELYIPMMTLDEIR